MPRLKHLLPALLGAFLLPVLASCGGGDGVASIPAPSGLTVTWDGVRAQLAWTGVGRAAAYRVERATGEAGTFATVASDVPATTFSEVVPPGLVYRYRVRAVGDGGTSAPSDEAVLDLGPASLEDLFVVRAAADAPPLETDSVSFWAVAGEDRRVRIDYLLPGGGRTDFMEFEVDDDALLARPDGTPFADGDSVLITVQVVDPSRYEVRFSPSGLRFDPDDPAELRISYRFADPDYDGDGVVDDDDLEFDFAVWRQAAPGLPWTRVGTAVFKEMEEVRADLESFSGYILAGGSRRFR